MTPSKAPSQAQNGHMEGTISINSRGMGFVRPDGIDKKKATKDNDIVIEPDATGCALHGDRVLIKLLPPRPNERPQGIVEEVVKRARMRFVGTVEQLDGRCIIAADSTRMRVPIAIEDDACTRLPKNTKVYVEMKPWTDPKRMPEGTILQEIGIKGKHEVEMRAIILEKGFESDHPEAVLAEAEQIAATAFPISLEEIAKREDFRNVMTCTIDPIDAKDFDDALSFKELPNGNYEVGVHIADVSHYVTPNSALDREADDRGFSVYLVDRTIPMLPEALSNHVCSLNPHEDRLAFSAIFELDEAGTVLNRRFAKCVIYSDKRFHYEEAQQVMDGKHPEEEVQKKWERPLRTLNAIAKQMAAAKKRHGAIDFDTTEIKFELDADGVPLRVVKKERLDAHRLIEEYMLLANREIATFMHKNSAFTKGADPENSAHMGLMYRIHAAPDPERISELSLFLKALGYELKISKNGIVEAKDINALLASIEGVPEEGLIKTTVVRSMSKAVYSTESMGHFGLAFEHYTHFTSPIRRYPDLLVHRIVHAFLKQRRFDQSELQHFAQAAESSSQREISAAEAERESVKYKQVQYWAARLGSVVDGVISGVTEWGIYVEEKETRAEGMIRLRDFGDDFYEFNEKAYCIVGKRTGKRYRLGDEVKAKIVKADEESKTLDLQLIA